MAVATELYDELRAGFNQLAHCVALGISCTRLERDLAVAELSIEEELRHPNGSVPGTYLAALADAAASFALQTALGAGESHVTASLGVQYLRPARTAPIVAQASVLGRGRNVGFANVELRDADGQLCATATGTWAIRLSTGS